MKTSPQSRMDAIRKLAAEPQTALFAGPPGAGKTKAAQDIAAELGLELRRIDLSPLVSGYIGETEKNIDRIFDAASEGAVLLFDEAEALFGKRTEVRDAHDRYAAAANYLLAKLEAHCGLAIVTGSNRQALDPAFLRRLRTVIEFPAPTD